MRQGLHLRMSLVLASLNRCLLTFLEMLAGKELGLTMATDLIELSDELSVLKVEYM